MDATDTQNAKCLAHSHINFVGKYRAMTDFRQQALDYHEKPVPGKISVELTKPAETVKRPSTRIQPWCCRAST